MAAYYNEFDPQAAAWLRELIRQGHIADGIVDERSIEVVSADDLREFTQCHFFAGIGVWSYALRQAGWRDDQSVWTASLPCQPWSSAGRGAGVDDERHLWPVFHRLVQECRPDIVLGEQVSSKDGLTWWDLVQDSLEDTGYAAGALDTCAAGVGGPHIRQRLYWVGHTLGTGLEGYTGDGDHQIGRSIQTGSAAATSVLDRLGNAYRNRRQTWGSTSASNGHGSPAESTGGGVGDPAGVRCDEQRQASGDAPEEGREPRPGCVGQLSRGTEGLGGDGGPSPTNGFWRVADWAFCRDGKWRPIEPGTSPLAARTPSGVVQLRGYGNGLNAIQAKTFIEAVMDTLQ